MATGRQFDLPYMVEQWDDIDSHVEELIGVIGDFNVARAAFDEAVKRRPGRIVTLRHKTRLLADQSQSMIVPSKELGGNMRKLFTAIATLMLLLVGSLVWKAEAATMSSMGSLGSLAKSHTAIQKAYYYRRGYYGYRRPYYGYGYRRHYYGYGYRPYYGGYYGWRRPYYRRWRY